MLFPQIRSCTAPRWLILAALLAPLGCTSAEEEQALEQESSNMRQLSVYIGQSTPIFRGPPPDEKAFREHITKSGGNPDEVLVSSRDGKPFVIMYKGDEGKFQSPYVAYEAEGVDGTRMVIDNLGVIETLTEEEFQQKVIK